VCALIGFTLHASNAKLMSKYQKLRDAMLLDHRLDTGGEKMFFRVLKKVYRRPIGDGMTGFLCDTAMAGCVTTEEREVLLAALRARYGGQPNSPKVVENIEGKGSVP
jgi:hypothetical protein